MKDKAIQIRVTEKEYAAFRELADEFGLSVSELMRQAARKYSSSLKSILLDEAPKVSKGEVRK